MIWRVIITGCIVLQLQAHANTQVTQTVTLKSLNSIVEETHEWILTPRKFRLNVRNSSRQVDYIFNGRTFVACLKVHDPQILKHRDFETNKAVLKNIKTGICLQTPINVVASFFLSPHNFVSALDVTDSLQLRLELQEYLKSNAKPAIAENSCKSQKRNFNYKYFAYLNEKYLTNVVNESGCFRSDMNWRQPLWKQLSRTLLQQKTGRTLRNFIMKNKIHEEGLATSKQGTYHIRDGKKTIRTISLNLKTEKVITAKDTRRDFTTPAEYQFYQSTENITIASSDEPQKRETQGNASKEARPDNEKLSLNILLYLLGAGF